LSLSAKQRVFLAAYERTGVVKAAAKAAKIAYKSHYNWLTDPEYKTAFAEAEEVAIELLEAEVPRRAMYGVQELVIYQGKLCFEPLRDPKTGQVKRDRKGRPLLTTTPLTIPRKSDNLLMFLLKALAPEKYRENAPVQRAAAASAPPQIKVVFCDRDKS
jgi:hypothetical protein